MSNQNSDGQPSLPGVADDMNERIDPSIEEKRGKSRKADRQEFFLPVTGFAWFYPEEVEVINHPAFQRLSRINQLGQTNLVFRGACHKRIEHVLGAVHVVQRMISAVNFNANKQQNKRQEEQHLFAQLSEEEQRFIRLGALLHDIGHIAAGHTLEDELGLIGKHDADERLNIVFDEFDWGEFGGKKQKKQCLRDLIDEQFRIWMPRSLAAAGLSATDVVRILIRKPPTENDPDVAKQHVLENSAELRLDVCANMIGNTICADLLDYIHRDWYHIGKPNFFDDRIFQYMEIRSPTNELKPSAGDRFVIALGQSPKIRTDGVSAILGLLEWRYQLAETALFHRTKLSAAAMLDRAFFELWEGKGGKELVNDILMCSDEELVEHAFSFSKQYETKVGAMKRRGNISRKILQKLMSRNLYTDLVTVDSQNVTPERRKWIQDTFGQGNNSEIGAKNRSETVRQLEIDFDLDPGSLAIYCTEIKPKIAYVRIAVGSEVATFHDYEIENEREGKILLSGGHLKAQVERFVRLWRIHFFIDREQKVALGITKLKRLQDFIMHHILHEDRDGRLKHTVEDIARAVVMETNENRKGKSDHELSFSRQRPIAARGDTAKKAYVYPNGVPCIRSFILEN